MKSLNLRSVIAIYAFVLVAGCGDKSNSEVGEFSNDLLGNEIKVEALPDPSIPGIICHMAYFDRGVIDRVSKGNWFENPSNSSVSCQKIGPVDLAKISTQKSGEEIFSQRQSLFFKRTAVRRIVDLKNRSILYVSHSREIVEGSAKMSISSVPLTAAEAATAKSS